MAHMTCECGHYMTNNQLPTDFGINCYADRNYWKIFEELKNGVDELYDIPMEDIEIWQCPACKKIYWFDKGTRVAKCYKKEMTLKYHSIVTNLKCGCGNLLLEDSLFHCYPDEEYLNIAESLYEKQKNGAVNHFEFTDSSIWIWRCQKCNCLYLYERESNTVQIYVLEK